MLFFRRGASARWLCRDMRKRKRTARRAAQRRAAEHKIAASRERAGSRPMSVAGYVIGRCCEFIQPCPNTQPAPEALCLSSVQQASSAKIRSAADSMPRVRSDERDRTDVIAMSSARHAADNEKARAAAGGGHGNATKAHAFLFFASSLPPARRRRERHANASAEAETVPPALPRRQSVAITHVRLSRRAGVVRFRRSPL